MYIAELNVRKFRHLEDVRIGPLPRVGPGSEVVVLAGPNGSGKSSLLELLSNGFSNMWGFSWNAYRRFGDSSFEMRLGLNEVDLDEIRDAISSGGVNDSDNMLTELESNPTYYVAFNFNDGEHSKDPTLNNKKRELVRRALTERLNGLYLKSDRYYPKKTYDRRQYWNWTNRTTPGYRFADGYKELREELFVRLPNGEDVPFSDLSSGEQEVFFILSFFLRNGVRDSVVFIDEPEMHLHPELVRRMVKIMLSIQPGNQVWLATHNAELIDEAGRDRSYFVTRKELNGSATVSRASDENELVEFLRTMFGYSGYVGLARKLVFLEGDSSSADRRVFSSLFPQVADQIRFIPLASASNTDRINRAVMAILSAGLGHSEFYLIRDRDYLQNQTAEKYKTGSTRIYVLQRHEIENYLLDETTICEIAEELTGVTYTSDEIKSHLKQISRSIAGDVLRDMVSARLAQLFSQPDCSIGNFEKQSEWLLESGEWANEISDGARERFIKRMRVISTELNQIASDELVREIFQTAQAEISQAQTGDGWKVVFPGKEILGLLAKRLNFGNSVILINAIVRRMSAYPNRIDPELRAITDGISGELAPDGVG